MNETRQMTFSEFSATNRKRSESPAGFGHRLSDWSLSDWFTATAGELGEAANIAKKLNRVRDGIAGNGDLTEADLRRMLADEIADTAIYLDLLASSQGIDLGGAIVSKFNRTSEKIGTDITLPDQPQVREPCPVSVMIAEGCPHCLEYGGES